MFIPTPALQFYMSGGAIQNKMIEYLILSLNYPKKITTGLGYTYSLQSIKKSTSNIKCRNSRLNTVTVEDKVTET